jgi:hypothetical protein
MVIIATTDSSAAVHHAHTVAKELARLPGDHYILPAQVWPAISMRGSFRAQMRMNLKDGLSRCATDR